MPPALPAPKSRFGTGEKVCMGLVWADVTVAAAPFLAPCFFSRLERRPLRDGARGLRWGASRSPCIEFVYSTPAPYQRPIHSRRGPILTRFDAGAAGIGAHFREQTGGT